MGGEFTYQPNQDPKTVLTTTAISHVVVKTVWAPILVGELTTHCPRFWVLGIH